VIIGRGDPVATHLNDCLSPTFNTSSEKDSISVGADSMEDPTIMFRHMMKRRTQGNKRDILDDLLCGSDSLEIKVVFFNKSSCHILVVKSVLSGRGCRVD
jgi:hypothetical protein